MPIVSDARRTESAEQAAMEKTSSILGEGLSTGAFVGSSIAAATHVADGICPRSRRTELEVSDFCVRTLVGGRTLRARTA